MTAAEKLLAHIRSLENAPLETHDDGQRLSLLLAANAGLLPGVDGVVGTEAPAHVYDDTGNVGDWRYDAATQTRWNRVWNDDTRQIFTVDLSASLSGGLLTEDIYLFDVATHTWEIEIPGVNAAGLWSENYILKDEAGATITTFAADDDILTDLEAAFPGYDVTVDGNNFTLTGPASRYPISGGSWAMRFTGSGDTDFTELPEIGILGTGEDPETEIPSILGTVEGSATYALETDTDVWGIVQAVGDPRSEYPQISTDEIKLLVGDTSKTAVAPSAATYPLPQWVSDPVANLP